MSDSTARNIQGAKFVARFQRASLIVDLEPRVKSNDNAHPTHSASAAAIAKAYLRGTVRRMSQLVMQQELPDPRPVWLHVLAPQEGGGDLDGDGRISATERFLLKMQVTLTALQQVCEL